MTTNNLPQQLFVDLGDFDRLGEPDEIFIRTALKGEPFDVCSFSAHETDFPKDYAQEIVRRYNEYTELKERYFTPDQIRIIQEQAYEAGFNAGQGMK